MSRALRVFGLSIWLLVLVLPGSAAADPPGPTNYRSSVLSIEPSRGEVSARIIGGDSFFELTVEPGHEVEVVGYRGEPYLLFEADGTVLENRLSPSKYLNEERYGTDLGPPEVDAAADPEWVVVASGGRFAWHDHRTHWMNPKRLPGAKPGDQILEAVVPLVVDGVDVDVLVSSVLVASPSPVSGGAGGIVGVVMVLVAWRRGRGAAALLSGVAAVALGIGLVANWSVPAETGPSLLGWVPAAVALGLGGLILAGGRAGRVRWPGTLTRFGVLLIGFGELFLWGWLRRSDMTSAIIPTDLPYWLDRAATAMALAVGVGGILLVLVDLFGPPILAKPPASSQS